MSLHFDIKRDHEGLWRWHLFVGHNEAGKSVIGYDSEEICRAVVEAIKERTKDAPVLPRSDL